MKHPVIYTFTNSMGFATYSTSPLAHGRCPLPLEVWIEVVSYTNPDKPKFKRHRFQRGVASSVNGTTRSFRTADRFEAKDERKAIRLLVKAKPITSVKVPTIGVYCWDCGADPGEICWRAHMYKKATPMKDFHRRRAQDANEATKELVAVDKEAAAWAKPLRKAARG